jgi:hypothetical protein
MFAKRKNRNNLLRNSLYNAALFTGEMEAEWYGLGNEKSAFKDH